MTPFLGNRELERQKDCMKLESKSGLKVFTYQDIKSWNPCYDPVKHIPPTWRGTTIDILNLEEVPFSGKLWVVLRTDLCSEKLMRLAAVWFYRDTLNWIKNPDPKSLNAANVAERYALGCATQGELTAAQASARSAAESARLSANSARLYADSAKATTWSRRYISECADWSASRAAYEASAESAVCLTYSTSSESAWNAAFYAARSAAEYACRARPEPKSRYAMVVTAVVDAWLPRSSYLSYDQTARRSSAKLLVEERYKNKLIEMLLVEGKQR